MSRKVLVVLCHSQRVEREKRMFYAILDTAMDCTWLIWLSAKSTWPSFLYINCKIDWRRAEGFCSVCLKLIKRSNCDITETHGDTTHAEVSSLNKLWFQPEPWTCSLTRVVSKMCSLKSMLRLTSLYGTCMFWMWVRRICVRNAWQFPSVVEMTENIFLVVLWKVCIK